MLNFSDVTEDQASPKSHELVRIEPRRNGSVSRTDEQILTMNRLETHLRSRTSNVRNADRCYSDKNSKSDVLVSSRSDVHWTSRRVAKKDYARRRFHRYKVRSPSSQRRISKTVFVALVAHGLKHAPLEGANVEEKRCQSDRPPAAGDTAQPKTSKTVTTSCEPRRQACMR